MCSVKRCNIFYFTIIIITSHSLADDSIYVINTRKSVNVVSDKFLSFNIDRRAVLSYINSSHPHYPFGKQLSPSYLRLSDSFSSKFIEFQTINKSSHISTISHPWKFLEVHPSMWSFFNKWLSNVGSIPVFILGENQEINDLSNSKNYISLLNLVDKLNITCFWQIDHGNTFKNAFDYIEEYEILRQNMEKYPNSKRRWKIIASNFEHYLENGNYEQIRQFLDTLMSISDVRILSKEYSKYILQLKEANNNKILHFAKNSSPTWLSFPMESKNTFDAVITWAREVGNAAKLGFEVIFSDGNLFSNSNIALNWFNVLHKHLIGRHVLEMKYPFLLSDVNVYSHCTKFQNAYPRSGSITVLAINNKSEEHLLALRITGSPYIRSLETHCYVLTADNSNSSSFYYNGRKLSSHLLQKIRFPLEPEIKRIHVYRNIILKLPPKSIGFFVFPGIRAPVCYHDEQFTELLVEEINKEHSVEENSEKTTNFEYFQQQNKPLNTEDVSLSEINKINSNTTESVTQETITTKKVKVRKPLDAIEIILNSGEIQHILKERAKAKAEERGINLLGNDLEKIVNHLTNNFKKIDNTISLQPKNYMDLKRSKRKVALNFDNGKKRDINMELLRKKTKEQTSPYDKFDENSDENLNIYERFPYPNRFHNERQSINERKQQEKVNHLNDKKYDLFKSNINKPTGQRNNLNTIFKTKPLNPIIHKQNVNNKPLKNLFQTFHPLHKKDKNYQSLEVEDSAEDIPWYFDNSPLYGRNGNRFENIDFKESDSRSTSEGKGFVNKDGDIEVFFSSNSGIKASKNKAKVLSSFKEYHKNIEDLRQSKIFGMASSNSLEDCIDSFELKDLESLRFKRDLTEFTEEDIQRYMRFMREQLKYMRIMQREARLKRQELISRSLRTNTLKKTPLNLTLNYNPFKFVKNKRHQVEMSSSIEHENNTDVLLSEPLKITIGKPDQYDKIKINERQRDAQIQMLKDRLMLRKRKEKSSNEDIKSKQTVEKIEEKREHSNHLKSEEDRKLKARKNLLEMWNINSQNRLSRSLNNSIVQNVEFSSKTQPNTTDKDFYRRLTPIDKWKPHNITLFTKNDSSHTLGIEKDKQTFSWTVTPVDVQVLNKFDIVHKRYKRFPEIEYSEEIDNEIKPVYKLYTKRNDKINPSVYKTFIQKERIDNEIISEPKTYSVETRQQNEINDKNIIYNYTTVLNLNPTVAKEAKINGFINDYNGSSKVINRRSHLSNKGIKLTENLGTHFFTNIYDAFESLVAKVNLKMTNYLKRIQAIIT